MIELTFHVEVSDSVLRTAHSDPVNDVLDRAFGEFFEKRRKQPTRYGLVPVGPEIGKGRENAFDYDGAVKIWFESPGENKPDRGRMFISTNQPEGN